MVIRCGMIENYLAMIHVWYVGNCCGKKMYTLLWWWWCSHGNGAYTWYATNGFFKIFLLIFYCYICWMILRDMTYAWFSHMLLMHENICCFVEHGLRLFLQRERAIWPWWGQEDELITDLNGKILWCWCCILGHMLMILKIYMLFLTLLLIDTYGANPIKYMTVFDDYHGLDTSI